MIVRTVLLAMMPAMAVGCVTAHGSSSDASSDRVEAGVDGGDDRLEPREAGAGNADVADGMSRGVHDASVAPCPADAGPDSGVASPRRHGADVALLAPRTPEGAQIYTWLSTGSALVTPPGVPWWSTDGRYSTGQIAHRMASGDFDGDGRSDIAALYDYGAGAARAHVWLSTGVAFAFQGSSGWWSTEGPYRLDRVDGRLVAGDFDEDGRDDIATLYDYGTGAARMHVWLSTGSGFACQGGAGWWGADAGYHVTAASGRFAAGDLDGDGRDDLVAVADAGCGRVRLQTWRSTGVHFEFRPDAGSGAVNASSGTSLLGGRIVVGDFDGSGPRPTGRRALVGRALVHTLAYYTAIPMRPARPGAKAGARASGSAAARTRRGRSRG